MAWLDFTPLHSLALRIWLAMEKGSRRRPCSSAVCGIKVIQSVSENKHTSSLSFGGQLRHFREARGWARKQLAYQAGCAVVTLQKIEWDERKPSLALAQRLGQALQLAPREYAAFIAAMQAADLLPAKPITPIGDPDPGLIGRDQERQLLVQWLINQGRRLLTLIGPSGVGKTRLAAVAARTDLGPYFPDGVHIVDLAALPQPARLASFMARALGCPVSDDRTAQSTLLAFLASRQLLLVLDQAEHLTDAAPLLTALLTHCPRLVLLVTARAALQLPGESALAVAPLALPPLPLQEPLDLATIGVTPAVALFVARAQAVQPDFTLTPANASAVVELCTRFEGLPLALELIAARVRLMSPQLLLSRLPAATVPRSGLTTQSLAALPGGQPSSQELLRDVLTRSYRLLTRAEQRAFGYFSLLQGGCRQVDAEVLLPIGGQEQEPVARYAWDLLSSLLDKNLIYQGTVAGEPRFLMLAAVRAYAQEQLTALGEAALAQRRHAEHYQRIAQVLAERIVEGNHLDRWLAAAEREQANWHAALRWCLATGEAALALRIATALWRFWWLQGYWQEGREWLEAGLAGFAATDGALYSLQARALHALGMLILAQGEQRAARQQLTTSLALARAIGDEATEALALSALATLWSREGAFAKAEAALLQSMAYDRKTGNTRSLALNWGLLGEINLSARKFAQALPALQQALALQTERNDHHGAMLIQLRLGQAYTELGDYVAARLTLESGLHLAHTLRDPLAEAIGLQLRAELAFATGEEQVGLQTLAAAFAIADTHMVQQNLASLLRVLSEARLRQGDVQLAIQLLGAVYGAQAGWAVQLDHHEQRLLDERLAQLRAHHPPDLCEQAYQTGYSAPTATIAQARAWLATQCAPQVTGQAD